jgi:hypothetical protein
MMLVSQDEDIVVVVMNTAEAGELELALGKLMTESDSVYQLYANLREIDHTVSDTVPNDEQKEA